MRPTVLKSLDPSRVAAHRNAEAANGFPLLRGCPNTFAIAVQRYLDTLSAEEAAQLVSDWEAAEAEAVVPDGAATVLGGDLAAYPALATFQAAKSQALNDRRIDTLPVKIVDGVLKDPATGGTPEGWARLMGLPEEAARFTTPHARSAADIVPIPPRDLRKAMKAAMQARFGAADKRLDAETTRYTGSLGDTQVAVDVAYVGNRGWRRQHQFGYVVWFKPGSGQRYMVMGYEALWGIHCEWNFLTVENADRSLRHLCDLVECLHGLLPEADAQAA